MKTNLQSAQGFTNKHYYFYKGHKVVGRQKNNDGNENGITL